jgi:hypothetical protein
MYKLAIAICVIMSGYAMYIGNWGAAAMFVAWSIYWKLHNMDMETRLLVRSIVISVKKNEIEEPK